MEAREKPSRMKPKQQRKQKFAFQINEIYFTHVPQHVNGRGRTEDRAKVKELKRKMLTQSQTL